MDHFIDFFSGKIRFSFIECVFSIMDRKLMSSFHGCSPSKGDFQLIRNLCSFIITPQAVKFISITRKKLS